MPAAATDLAAPLEELDRAARSHMTVVSNHLHLAAARLRAPASGPEDAEDHLREALAGLEQLQDVLDDVRRLARRGPRAPLLVL